MANLPADLQRFVGDSMVSLLVEGVFTPDSECFRFTPAVSEDMFPAASAGFWHLHLHLHLPHLLQLAQQSFSPPLSFA